MTTFCWKLAGPPASAGQGNGRRVLEMEESACGGGGGGRKRMEGVFEEGAPGC